MARKVASTYWCVSFMCMSTDCNVMSAIDIMVESLKRIILDASTEKLKLPMILPVESMEGITE